MRKHTLLVLGLLCFAGCGGSEVRDDKLKVNSVAQDPPPGSTASNRPPLGAPRTKVAPGSLERKQQ